MNRSPALALAIVLSLTALSRRGFADAPSAGLATTAEVSKDETAPHFHGFAVDVTIADGTGLNAVGHNYRNDLNLYLEPTWYVGKRFLRGTRFSRLSVVGRWVVTQNLAGVDEANFGGSSNAGPQGTCSNITPSENGGVVDPAQVGYCNPQANDRRIDYSDVWLTVRNSNLYTIPKAAVNVSPSVRFVLPTSAESRFQTMRFALTPSLGLSRQLWKDRITVGYSLGFTKYFHQYTSPQVSPSSGGQVSSQGGNPTDGATGAGVSNFYADPSRVGTIAGYNPSFSFTHVLSGDLKINDRWSLEALFLLIDAYAYNHSCTGDFSGSAVDLCKSGDTVAASSGTTLSPTHKMPTQILWLSLGYRPYEWLQVTLSYINWAPLLKPDSSYRQGFLSTDYNAFTTVQLGATVSLDKVATKLF